MYYFLKRIFASCNYLLVIGKEGNYYRFSIIYITCITFQLVNPLPCKSINLHPCLKPESTDSFIFSLPAMQFNRNKNNRQKMNIN